MIIFQKTPQISATARYGVSFVSSWSELDAVRTCHVIIGRLRRFLYIGTIHETAHKQYRIVSSLETEPHAEQVQFHLQLEVSNRGMANSVQGKSIGSPIHEETKYLGLNESDESSLFTDF